MPSFRTKSKTAAGKPRRAPPRNPGRRLVRWASLLLFALPILVAALWLAGGAVWQHAFCQNDFFAIRHILVTTDGTIPSALVEEYAHARRGDNLFAIHPRDMQAALEKVSAIAWAQVGRQLPDTLLIEIGERMAIARIGDVLAVDATGHVLGPRSVRPALPLIRGIRDTALLPGARIQDPAFPTVIRILELCNRPEMKPEIRIRAIDIENDRLFSLYLDTPTVIRISTPDLLNKLNRLPIMLRVAKNKGLAFPEYDLTMASNYVGRIPLNTQEPPAHAN